MQLTISRIKAFKACRRLYELKYVEGMEPVQKPEALETGSNYHALLEQLNTEGAITHYDGEYSKELAMAKAYEKYIYPHFKVVEVEKAVTYHLADGDTLYGIVDGIAEDGHLVEHKSAGVDITEAYEYNLQWDEQILAYMLMTGSRKMWYTLCRKPTIRQKKDESEEEFFNRMVAWYDEDTESKIRYFEVTRTDDEVLDFLQDLKQIYKEIKESKHYYKNTGYCNVWGRRCEYSPICLNYQQGQEYVEYMKRDDSADFR